MLLLKSWLIFQKKKKLGGSLLLLLPSSVSLPVTATIKIRLLHHLSRRGAFWKDSVNTLWVSLTHMHMLIFLFHLYVTFYYYSVII